MRKIFSKSTSLKPPKAPNRHRRVQSGVIDKRITNKPNLSN
jgi:hypothetical protein